MVSAHWTVRRHEVDRHTLHSVAKVDGREPQAAASRVNAATCGEHDRCRHCAALVFVHQSSICSSVVTAQYVHFIAQDDLEWFWCEGLLCHQYSLDRNQ